MKIATVTYDGKTISAHPGRTTQAFALNIGDGDIRDIADLISSSKYLILIDPRR
jgi:hypothetical protein